LHPAADAAETLTLYSKKESLSKYASRTPVSRYTGGFSRSRHSRAAVGGEVLPNHTAAGGITSVAPHGIRSVRQRRDVAGAKNIPDHMELGRR